MYRLGHNSSIPRWRSDRNGFASEEGSISVITIGLFSILLTLSMALTDISSVYLAKRSLTMMTETAVQQGMKNLDQASYYSGEYSATQMLSNLLGGGDEDGGIPIDCRAGAQDASSIFLKGDSSVFLQGRKNLTGQHIIDFQCDGFQIYLESAATATLPVPIPFIGISEVSISTHAGGVGERADTNNYYGFDIG